MHIHFRRLFRILVFSLLLTLLLFAMTSIVSAEGTKKLTVMVYAIGTDLESRPGAAVSSDYLIRMLHSGFDREQINVVLLTGGCSYWKTGFPTDVNTFQVLDGDIRPTEVHRTTNLLNMGDGNTLTYLLNYGVNNYPAENYALIVEDHGGGPMAGICYDELYQDMISLPELSAALEKSPFGPKQKLSWIYFCTCLTGSAEIASVCAPYADYMFASEEPALSFAFRFSFLNGAENRDPAETGRMIADSFYDAAQELNRSLTAAGDSAVQNINTFAVYDLRQMDLLKDAMEVLFTAVDTGITDQKSFDRILSIVNNAQRVNPSPDYSEDDLIDLRSLVKGYTALYPNECAGVIHALDEVVIHSRSNNDQETGMLIYHPIRNKLDYRMSRQADYRVICPFPAYLAYTERFGDVLLGKPLVTYPTVEEHHFFSLSGNTAPVSLALDEAQQRFFREAELLILEDTGTEGMYRLISRQALSPDDTGELTAQTANEALYAVDEDGRFLTDALEYELVDGQILLRGVMEIDPSNRALTLGDINAVELSEDSNLTVNVLLRCIRKADGSLQIVSIEPVHDRYVDGNRIDPSEFDYLHLVSTPKRLTRENDGSVLAFDEWESGGIISYRYTIDLSENWSLAFRDDQLTWVGRSAMLVITDTQSNHHAVEWIALENPANNELPAEIQSLFDDGKISVMADRSWLNHGTDGDSLFIRLSLTNGTDAPVTFISSGYAVDDTALEKDAELLGTVQPGQTGSATILIRAGEAVSPLADANAVSLILSTEAETGFGLWESVSISLR